MKEKYSFRLLSLVVNSECKEYLSKNLVRGETYHFINGDAPSLFWEKGINVSAIVGVNGSGKSAILDIIFRMINNLYAVLFRKTDDNYDQLLYVRGVYGNSKVYHLVIEKCTTFQSGAKLHLI